VKGGGDVDDALARTGAARGQRDALPTAVAFDHITTALYHRERLTQEARVGQIYFGDQAESGSDLNRR
jgi:hypothetical protein